MRSISNLVSAARIKAGLKCCAGSASCMKCTYYIYRDRKYTCEGMLMADALAYIQELEHGIDKIYAEIHEVAQYLDKQVAKTDTRKDEKNKEE